MSVISEIAAERVRQMLVEGWTLAHDDKHKDGSLAAAAATYALHASRWPVIQMVRDADDAAKCYADASASIIWPRSWARKWWKPKGPRRDLIRAAALIVAEIERLDRLAEMKSAQ